MNLKKYEVELHGFWFKREPGNADPSRLGCVLQSARSIVTCSYRHSDTSSDVLTQEISPISSISTQLIELDVTF